MIPVMAANTFYTCRGREQRGEVEKKVKNEESWKPIEENIR
jgi:hypothetical protein